MSQEQLLGQPGADGEQESLFKPDDVYKMPSMEDFKLSPANIIRALVPYLSKDENRYALMFISINDKFLQATDGHRFIRIERDKMIVPIPNGSYRPVKDGKDYLLIALPHNLELPFPNTDTLMPETWDHEFERKAFDPKGPNGVGELLYKLAKLNVCMNHSYAEDLPAGDYRVLVRTPLHPVIFIGDYQAGIMPLKLSEEA